MPLVCGTCVGRCSRLLGALCGDFSFPEVVVFMASVHPAAQENSPAFQAARGSWENGRPLAGA